MSPDSRQPVSTPPIPGTGALFAALRPLAGRLPVFPGSLLLATGANLAFGAAPPQALAPLFGKVVRIHVTDAGLRFDLGVTPRGFVACRDAAAPAVVISAAARDFLRLARRETDPDTLFFDRRLSIEGDTELGLLLKNTLDALDLKRLPGALPGLPGVFAALRAGLRG